MTWHEIIGLMWTKYNCSDCSRDLSLCTCYIISVSFTQLSMLSCCSGEHHISIGYLNKNSYWTFYSEKSFKFYVYMSPISHAGSHIVQLHTLTSVRAPVTSTPLEVNCSSVLRSPSIAALYIFPFSSYNNISNSNH